MVATFVVVGATCMMLVERRSAVDAFYWAVTTVTTVGYGDITPETDGGRLFVLLFVTCAVATLAWAGTTLVEVAVVATSEATAAKVFRRRENNTRSPRQSRGRQGIRHGDGFHEGGVGAAGKMRRAGFPNHRGKFRRVGRQRGQDHFVEDLVGDVNQLAADLRACSGGEREREKGGRRGWGLKTTDPHA